MITLVLKKGPLGPRTKRYDVPHIHGKSLIRYIPKKYLRLDTIDVKVDGVAATDEDLERMIPADGCTISIVPVGGIWGVLASFVLSVALQIGLWAYDKYVEQPDAERKAAIGDLGPTYAFDVMQNVYGDGHPIPVVMGIHRVGGIVMQQFTHTKRVRPTNEGSIADYLTSHIVPSYGPINNLSDIHANGNDLTDFSDAESAWRKGLLTFETLGKAYWYEAGATHSVSNQLNAPGGGVNVITLTGTVACRDIVLKVTFLTGCYGTKDGYATLNKLPYKFRWRRNGLTTNVDQNSTAGTKLLYVAATATFEEDDVIIINEGGAREETGVIDTIQDGVSITLVENLTNNHTAVQADAVDSYWSDWSKHDNDFTSKSRFSVFIYVLNVNDLGRTLDTYDLQFSLQTATHNADQGVYGDCYLTEWQENDWYEMTYPGLALYAVTNLSSENLSGIAPRYTALVEGIKIQTMSSATAVAASSHTRNPADLLLAMLFNQRWGLATRIDTRLRVTLAGVAGGPFTVDEIIKGPADDYQFKGIVKSWDAGDSEMVVESRQGLPHGLLTGQTSNATGTMSSIDESYGVDLTSMYAMKTFNNEWVPDGAVGTTVDVNSASGQKILSVASTTPFTAGDTVIIHYQGAREESKVINTIQAGVSITLTENLTYTHTLAQADDVRVAERRHFFDYVWDGKENGWEAVERICKCCRTMPVMYGGYLKLVPLQAETPVQICCEGNMAIDELTVSFEERGTRPNYMQISILDEDYDYTQQVVPCYDEESFTNNEKIRKTEFELYGITRQSQTQREGYFRLKRIRNVRKVIQFRLGIYHIDFEIGDVIRVAHRLLSAGVGSGRVQSSTNTSIVLDHPATISGGETVYVLHADGSVEEETVTSPAGTHKEISISAATWTANPDPEDLYIIGEEQYRVISIQPAQDFKAIVIAEEDDDAYYNDDYGVKPEYDLNNIQDPDEIPPDAENVTISEENPVNPNGDIENILKVWWENGTQKTKVQNEIWYRRGLGARYSYGRRSQDGETVGNYTLNLPCGICISGNSIFVSDTIHHRVLKLSYPDFDYEDEIGTADFTAGNGNDEFDQPMGLTADETHFFVCDSNNHRVKKHLIADMSYVDEIGTFGNGVDQFKYPTDIAMTASVVLVTDRMNHRIAKIDLALDGNAGAGTWDTFGAFGAGNDQFKYPFGIDIAVAEDLFIVADQANNRLCKVDVAFVGAGGGTFDTVGSLGYDTDKFAGGPYGVAIDHNDAYIYVTDYGYAGGSTLYARCMARNYTSLAAATVFPGSTSEWGGEVGSGLNQMDHPIGISVDRDNQGLYGFIVDRLNYRVLKIAFITEGLWRRAGSIDRDEFTIKEKFQIGDHITAAVLPLSPSGNRKNVSDGASDSHIVAGTAETPGDVEQFTFTQTGWGEGKLWWSPAPSDKYSKYYEVRMGTDWETGETIFENFQGVYKTIKAPPGSSTKFWIKSFNGLHHPCANPKSVTAVMAMGGMMFGSEVGGKIADQGNIKAG